MAAQLDGATLPVQRLDGHRQAIDVQALIEAVGPLAHGHTLILAHIEEPAGESLLRVSQSIEVLVEQAEAALVLGHQREAGAVDDLADAQPDREALGELRLAGPQRSHQRQAVPRLGGGRQRGRQLACLPGGPGDRPPGRVAFEVIVRPAHELPIPAAPAW